MQRRHRRASVLVALSAVLFAVGIAAAHDTWLIADSGQAARGQRVLLSLTSGVAFPEDDFAIAPARVKRATVRLHDSTRTLTNPRSTARAMQYAWTPRAEGIAAAGVELTPKTLLLEPDKIEEYMTEIDATPELRREWAALAGKRKWIESYSKHAKTFISVGQPRADSSWARPVGLGLELVPERDPTALRAGDTLVLRVLHHGQALAGFAVGAIREGSTTTAFLRTDAAGRARVPFNAAGKWLLNGTWIVRSKNPKLTWESDFTTLTLHVR